MRRFVEVVDKRGKIVDWVDYDKAVKLTLDNPSLGTALEGDMLADEHLRLTRLFNGKFVLIRSKDPLGENLEVVILTKKETVGLLQLWNADDDDVQRNYKKYVQNYYKTNKIKSFVSVLIIITIIFSFYFSVSYFQPDTQIKNISATGSDAKLYLQDNQYDNIIIEIDYVKGREPNNKSLNELVTFLENICDKDQIPFVWSDLIILENYDVNTIYSTEDLRNFERQYRDYFNNDNTVVIYILYLNGNFSSDNDDKRVIGRAYSSSSLAMSIDVINLETESRALYNKENYTLHHEVGHLLGLVNFGYESENPHENKTKPGHCIIEDCIMRKGKNYDLSYNFCNYCMDDLEKLKSNIY
jgi:predicted Zn-dependent protease